MKKASHIITLAALAAAGAAHAQSVNLYGIIDVGVEHVSNVSGVGSITRMPSNTSSLPSRVGFRGTEDLGDGLKAQFTLEMGFAPDTGASGQGGRLFGRQANVGLAGPWGSVTLGRQYSTLFWSIQDSDVIGPALYALGSLDSYIPNSRADNSIAYRGTFSGLTLGAEYSLGRDTVNAGPSPVGTNCAGESGTDTQACRQWSATAKYDTADWGATLTYDTLNGRTPASATDVVFGGLNSSSTSDSRTLAAAYVKVMGAKIGGGVMRRNNEGSTTKPKSDLWYIGASYPLTTALTLDGQWASLRYKNFDNGNSTLLSARLVYALSKRTAVYTQVGHISNDKLAAVSVSGGATGSAPAAGGSQNGVSFGIRHAF
jgi:predicted porin